MAKCLLHDKCIVLVYQSTVNVFNTSCERIGNFDVGGWTTKAVLIQGTPFVAVGYESGEVEIWNIKTCQLHQKWVHFGEIMFVNYSPDLRRVLSCGMDGKVRLTDPLGEADHQILEGHIKARCVGYSPELRRIITGAADGRVRLADPTGAAETQVLEVHTDRILSVTYIPEIGRMLSVSGKMVGLTDPSAGEMKAVEGPSEGIACASFSSDLRRVITGYADGTVRITDPMGGAAMQVLKVHTESVICATYCPSLRRVVSCSEDKTVRLVDPKGDVEVKVLEGHSDVVVSAEYSLALGRVVSASFDRTVRVTDPAGRAEAKVLVVQQMAASASYSTELNRLVSAYEDGSVHLTDLKGLAGSQVLRCGSKEVTRASYSAELRRLIVEAAEWAVFLTDPTDGAETQILRYEPVTQRDSFMCSIGWASYSPDLQRVLVAVGDGTVRLTDPTSSKEQVIDLKLEGPVDMAQQVTYSQTLKRLVCAVSDGTVRLLDPEGVAEPRLLEQYEDMCSYASYSEDLGRVVSACSLGQKVLLTDPTGSAKTEVLNFHGRPRACAHGSFRLLAVGFEDGGIVILRSPEDQGSMEMLAETKDLGCLTSLTLNGDELAAVGPNGQVFYDLNALSKYGVLARTKLPRHTASLTSRCIPFGFFGFEAFNLAVGCAQTFGFAFTENVPQVHVLKRPSQILRGFQTFGINFDFIDAEVTYASLFIGLVFIALFFGQEGVEERAWLNPKGRWPTVFFLIGIFCRVCAGPGLIPLLKGLSNGFRLTFFANPLLDASLALLSVVTSIFVVVFAFRLIRVDFQLSDIEANLARPWDRSLDRVRKLGDRAYVHRLSCAEPQRDAAMGLVKVCLLLNSMLVAEKLGEIAAGGVRLLLALSLFVCGLRYPPHFAWPGGVDLSAVRTGLDTALVTAYLASLAATATQNVAFSFMVLLVPPVAVVTYYLTRGRQPAQTTGYLIVPDRKAGKTWDLEERLLP